MYVKKNQNMLQSKDVGSKPVTVWLGALVAGLPLAGALIGQEDAVIEELVATGPWEIEAVPWWISAENAWPFGTISCESWVQTEVQMFV